MPCPCGRGSDCKCAKKEKPSTINVSDQTSTVCRLCKRPTPVLRNEEIGANVQVETCSCFITQPLELSSSSEDSGPQTYAVRCSAEDNSTDLYAASSSGSEKNIDRWRDVPMNTDCIPISSTSEEEAATLKPPRYTRQRKNVNRSKKDKGESNNENMDVSNEQANVSESTGQLGDDETNNRQENESSSLDLPSSRNPTVYIDIIPVNQEALDFWQQRPTHGAVALPVLAEQCRPLLLRPEAQRPQPRVQLDVRSVVPAVGPRIIPGPSFRPRQSYFHSAHNVLENPQLNQHLSSLAESAPRRSGKMKEVQNWLADVDSSPETKDVIQPVPDEEEEQQATETSDDSNVIQSVSDQEAEQQARRLSLNRRLSYTSTTDESSNNARPSQERRPNRPRRKVPRRN